MTIPEQTFHKVVQSAVAPVAFQPDHVPLVFVLEGNARLNVSLSRMDARNLAEAILLQPGIHDPD